MELCAYWSAVIGSYRGHLLFLHGFGTIPILLAGYGYGLGQLAAVRYQVWLAGASLYALPLVRSATQQREVTLTMRSATASKANWITLVTGVTHEKLQVFHRWIAYAFLILALMHTFPFIVWHIRNHDMVVQFTVSNIFEYWTGIVALVFQAWLTFASWGPIR
jgi:hypothetical protein